MVVNLNEAENKALGKGLGELMNDNSNTNLNSLFSNPSSDNNELGKLVWQKHLFPRVKTLAKEMDIEDPNEIVLAVKDWLNNH